MATATAPLKTAGGSFLIEDQLPAAPFEFLAEIIKHSVVLQMRGIGGRSDSRLGRSLLKAGWRRLG